MNDNCMGVDGKTCLNNWQLVAKFLMHSSLAFDSEMSNCTSCLNDESRSLSHNEYRYLIPWGDSSRPN